MYVYDDFIKAKVTRWDVPPGRKTSSLLNMAKFIIRAEPLTFTLILLLIHYFDTVVFLGFPRLNSVLGICELNPVCIFLVQIENM